MNSCANPCRPPGPRTLVLTGVCPNLPRNPGPHLDGRNSFGLFLYSTPVLPTLLGGAKLTGDRITPSTHVDDIARLLSDDSSCTHSVWSGSRYGGPGRAVVRVRDPSDGSDGHSSVVRETAGRLEKRGDDVFPAFRNGFEATGSVSGARIVGRPDIIARHADGSVTVYDLGTGEPGAEAEVRRAVGEYLRRIDQVQQLLVLRTDPGAAQPLALAIDRAELPEVVGTVAGDDTILLITRHARAGREVTRLFEGWARG